MQSRVRSSGFTLIEILMILAIVATLLGLGLNSYVQEIQRRGLYEDIATLTYTLEQARSISVKTSTDQTVTVVSSGNQVNVTYNGITSKYQNLAFCDKTQVSCATTTELKFLSPTGEFCWSSGCLGIDARLDFTRNSHSATLVLQGVFGYATIRDLK